MPPPRSLIYKLWLLLLGPAVGQRVVQSPSALTLLRGQTARINCSLLSGEERVDSVRYYWFRTRDNPGISRNESRKFLKLGARLSVSDSLVIREVTVDDSDTYHCSVLRQDQWKAFTGNGTELNIQAKPDVSLTLDPEVEAAGIHTLTCAAAGFLPRDLNISWAVTGDVSYEVEAGPLSVNGDRTYNLSSRLRVTDTRREAGAVATCLVRHVTGSESVRRSFSFSRGFPKYYFALLSLIFIIPLCIWIIKNQCRKLKNGKEPSVHDKNVDNQITRKRIKDSVNKARFPCLQ
ncbi:signal-regulatory protein beta-1-like isoform X2 [Pristis pectinata]|uniref:signal-regulatory protein beta-1-like isoform X2 n=1 Tax=Pristis pectinata TaxID=685728 RepID=UPI00223D1284|nr:signal-regulatory protein beta-1-like isoform X2 [Pristis pectinata]